jgi:ABC-type transport system involved in multi-copper enzyme maturation permease subunit
VVYDQGRSTILRDLAAREDIRVRMVESQKEMVLSLVGSTDLALGLVLPADFDQRAGEGQPIELQAYYPHWAVPDRFSQLEAFFEEQFHQAAPGLGQLILVDQAVYPPVELSGQPAMLLMNLVVVILVIGIALVPLLMIEEKEAQTLKVLLVSPASLKQVVAGKALVGLFYSLLPAMLVMLLYRYLFVHWGVALLAVFLTSALAVGVGLLLGVLADSPTSASMWGSLLLLMVLGSGLLKLFGLNLPPAVFSPLWIGCRVLPACSYSASPRQAIFHLSMLWLNMSPPCWQRLRRCLCSAGLAHSLHGSLRIGGSKMKSYSVSALLILAVLTIFWAYTVMDTLLREFSADVTIVDLGVLVVLGFIAGLAFGLIPAARSRESTKGKIA